MKFLPKKIKEYLEDDTLDKLRKLKNNKDYTDIDVQEISKKIVENFEHEFNLIIKRSLKKIFK